MSDQWLSELCDMVMPHLQVDEDFLVEIIFWSALLGIYNNNSVFNVASQVENLYHTPNKVLS